MSKKIVTMLSSQTIIDLALQVQGDVSKVFDLIQDNEDIDNIHSGFAGARVEYEEQSLSLTEHFKNNTINIVSGFPTVGGELGMWILLDGTWDDNGTWDDTATWND